MKEGVFFVAKSKKRSKGESKAKFFRKKGQNEGQGRPLKKKHAAFTGTMMKNRRGFGFIRPAEGDDIFVPADAMKGAMDGDIVEAELFTTRGRSKLSAKVLRILERKHRDVTGILTENHGLQYVIPIDRHNMDAILVPSEKVKNAEDGDTVLVRIKSYPKGRRPAEGKILELIAKKGDKDAKVLGCISDHKIRTEFPKVVLDEASRFTFELPEEEMARRKDYRDLLTVTIDGADSKDFDDAVSLRRADNGNYLLYVHIADVAEYVRPWTALDKEAFKRGNSVYLPDRVLPMLPEVLSNGLCSLNPGEDRLTLTCAMEIDTEGHINQYEISESVIRSDHRLVYDDVSDILENHDQDLMRQLADVVPMLCEMKDLAAFLHERRMRDGSINFEAGEAKIILDESKTPMEVRKVEPRTANNMIEEFMLAANRTVAEHFFWKKAPFVYRIHEKPDVLKVNELKEFLGGLGITMTGRSDSLKPKEFATVLRRVEGTPQENLIHRIMIRTMQKAVYSTECRGHFGLAFRFYCHFTSPIRRYPDLLVHRTVKAYLQGKEATIENAKYRDFLVRAADHSSETERNAIQLERVVTKYYMTRYMSYHLDEVFDGIISGVTSSGLYVELPNTVEGFVRYDSLDEYFYFDEKAYQAVGEVSGTTYALGDPVRIKVLSTDEDMGHIDFEMIGRK